MENFVITNKMAKLIKLAILANKQEEVKGQVIEELIKQRYSITQELAINRQREDKPNKFNEYNEYCNKCKEYAKEILGIE